MSLDEYKALVRRSGPLKIKGLRLLALGEPEERFEAAVLYHEAARLERQALEALPDADPVTRLRSLVEVCACLVAGLDPVGAQTAWDRVLEASKAVEPAVAAAIRSKTEPRFEALRREFARRFKQAPRIHPSYRMDPYDVGGRVAARLQLDPLLRSFPGIAHLWVERYTLDHLDKDYAKALDAVQRARRLDPNWKVLKAFTLWLEPLVAPREGGPARPVVPADDSILLVAAIMGQIEAAYMAETPKVRETHLDYADELLALPPPVSTSERLRQFLPAAKLMAREAREGRAVSREDLARLGIGSRAGSNPSPLSLLASAALAGLREAA